MSQSGGAVCATIHDRASRAITPSPRAAIARADNFNLR
jgi:hypothetical protein